MTQVKMKSTLKRRKGFMLMIYMDKNFSRNISPEVIFFWNDGMME
jgi:hypothetical protein